MTRSQSKPPGRGQRRKSRQNTGTATGADHSPPKLWAKFLGVRAPISLPSRVQRNEERQPFQKLITKLTREPTRMQVRRGPQGVTQETTTTPFLNILPAVCHTSNHVTEGSLRVHPCDLWACDICTETRGLGWSTVRFQTKKCESLELQNLERL